MHQLLTANTLTLREQIDLAWRLLKDNPAHAEELAQTLRDDPEVALRARTVLCAAALHSGQHVEALSAALELVDRFRAHADPPWLTRALNIAALASDALVQRDLALAHSNETLEVARGLRSLSLQGLPLLDISVLWLITDRQKAATHFRTAIEVLEQAAPEGQSTLAHAYVNLGILEYEAGRHNEGARLIERGRDSARSNREVGTWVSAVSHLARVYTERGNVVAARRELQDALARFPELSGSARRSLLYAQIVIEHHAGEYQRSLNAIQDLNECQSTEVEQQALLPVQADAHAQLEQYERAYALIQDFVTLNKGLYKTARETQLLQLEEKYQVETARRDAVVRQLEAEAARREAAIKHLENVELQHALESNAVLIESLRNSQLVSETLLGVSQLMQLELDPLDLARHALTLVTRVVDVDWCTLAHIRNDEVTFETVWVRNDEHEAFVRLTLPKTLSPREPLLQRFMQQNESTFLSYDQTMSAFPPALVTAGVQGLACLPAGTMLNFTYVLLLGRMRHDRRWTEHERQVLGATGRSLRAAVEMQERTQRSNEAALTDALTGLANRRAFETHLRHAMEDATFSVVMVDLDNLKYVNDTRGHAAGDMLLQIFTSTLRANVLPGTHAFRLGGDEIALLIEHHPTITPDAVQASTAGVLAATVATVRTAGFSNAGCSFGVARWPDEARLPMDVVALADTRLYADKQARKGGTAGARPKQDSTPRERIVTFADVILNVQSRELRGSLGQTKLSPREVEVLHILASRDQRVVLRGDLVVAGGIAGAEASGALDVHVSHVRRKLASVTERAGIRTVRGQGYSLQWYNQQGDE